MDDKLAKMLNVPLIAFINGKESTFVKNLNDNGIIYHSYDLG